MGSVAWFTSLTGGTSVYTGTNFTTPSITNTTTYYVSAVSGSCSSSSRTAVTATVNNLPEIDITGNSVSIANGDTTPDLSDWTDFGSLDISTGTVIRTFTVYNNGSSTLTLSNPTISGPNASDFSVSTNISGTSINGGFYRIFRITFNPSAIGIRTAIINVVNNDNTKNPYTFTIQGTGTNAEIDVLGNGISITDGSTSASVSNNTDF
jgi:hypothetical protein